MACNFTLGRMFNAAYVGHGLTPTSVVAEARSADSKVLLALIADKTMVATFAGAAMMPNALHCYSIFPHRRSKGSKRDTVWFSHKESDRERELGHPSLCILCHCYWRLSKAVVFICLSLKIKNSPSSPLSFTMPYLAVLRTPS
jgi:hypothetical protein